MSPFCPSIPSRSPVSPTSHRSRCRACRMPQAPPRSRSDDGRPRPGIFQQTVCACGVCYPPTIQRRPVFKIADHPGRCARRGAMRDFGRRAGLYWSMTGMLTGTGGAYCWISAPKSAGLFTPENRPRRARRSKKFCRHERHRCHRRTVTFSLTVITNRSTGSAKCAPMTRLREAIHFAAQRKNGWIRRKSAR